MNIEIMRNTLYKAYLDDFSAFCNKLGGTTGDVMGNLLSFEVPSHPQICQSRHASAGWLCRQSVDMLCEGEVAEASFLHSARGRWSRLLWGSEGFCRARTACRSSEGGLSPSWAAMLTDRPT